MDIRRILRESWWQLMAVYSLCVLAIAMGWISRYTLQFHVFALALGVLGLYSIGRIEDKYGEEAGRDRDVAQGRVIGIAVIVLVIISLLIRTIPYFTQSIPLGYDVGIYKYAMEHGLANKDTWILQGGIEPLSLYILTALRMVFSSGIVLTWGLVFFCGVLGVMVYWTGKEYFGRTQGLIALVLYAFSVVQFKAFALAYYKNIIALSVMLFALVMMKKHEVTKGKKWWWGMIISAGLLGPLHRPTFYIFGLSYFIFTFISPYEKKHYDSRKLGEGVIAGVLMIVIGLLFYIGDFWPAIGGMIEPIVGGFLQPGESPGTFISFFNYQFSSLAYLPFAVLGLGWMVMQKRKDMLVIWAIVNAVIVYFQFFFYNRFIIFLDIALILFAAQGFYILIRKRGNLGLWILGILLVSSVMLVAEEAKATKPLISQEALNAIKKISEVTEKDAMVISISKNYSPWVLGYSERETIAPGLFDANKWDESEWNTFWTTQSKDETKSLMNDYSGKTIYLFSGSERFNNPCFTPVFQEQGQMLLRYQC